jgi:hypothetical protein
VHTNLDIYVYIAKLIIHIEKKTTYLLFFKEGLTWFEAQRCCASRSGQLATIDDNIVSCNNIQSGAKTFWTGNVRKPSEWIEFQGKLNEIERYTYKYFK